MIFKMEYEGKMVTVDELAAIRRAKFAALPARPKPVARVPEPFTPTAPFQVELVWNREFHFVPNGPGYYDLALAIDHARSMENLGDGASVKKTRIVDDEGRVVWQYGKLVT